MGPEGQRIILSLLFPFFKTAFRGNRTRRKHTVFKLWGEGLLPYTKENVLLIGIAGKWNERP
jgi:hypothetical protein